MCALLLAPPRCSWMVHFASRFVQAVLPLLRETRPALLPASRLTSMILDQQPHRGTSALLHAPFTSDSTPRRCSALLSAKRHTHSKVALNVLRIALMDLKSKNRRWSAFHHVRGPMHFMLTLSTAPTPHFARLPVLLALS